MTAPLAPQDLTDELRRQAAQAETWPVPDVRRRARRTTQRRLLVAGAVGCAAVAAAVVGVVVVPGVRGDDRPVGPAASPSATPGASLDWHAVDCAPASEGGCDVPDILEYDGLRYRAVEGGSQPMVAPNGVNRSLSLQAEGDDRVYLVGGLHKSAATRIEVGDTVGMFAELGQTDGRLLLLERIRTGMLTVTEHGPVDPNEVLFIEEYVALDH